MPPRRRSRPALSGANVSLCSKPACDALAFCEELIESIGPNGVDSFRQCSCAHLRSSGVPSKGRHHALGKEVLRLD